MKKLLFDCLKRGWLLIEKKTTIISAFPLCGKTYFSQNCGDFVVIDSDSSNFSWVKDSNGNRTSKRNPDFPGNYIEHIKSNIGKVDYILVSTLAGKGGLSGHNICFTKNGLISSVLKNGA